MAEQTPSREGKTPLKSSTEMSALTTPTGGRLYNPFHENYVARLGEVTLTPGLFAPSKSMRHQSTEPVPFVWSPEIQGDHFPTEIDDNPTYQMQMQQELDEDVEEVAQTAIKTYFTNTIIAPSPGVNKTSSESRPPYPRTSTVKPLLISLGGDEQAMQRTVLMRNVEIQTAISIAPDTDVAALLQKAIQVGEEEENKENVVSTEIHLSHKHCGVVFSGALARHTEEVYLRASSSLFTYCQHCLRPIYSSQFSHFSDSSGDKTIKEGPSLDETRTIYDSQSISAEDVETIADDLGLPVSWASVSASHREDIDRFDQNSTTNLTGLFERAQISASQRSPHREHQPSSFFDSVSPQEGGRTSPEERGVQRSLPLSFLNDDFEEFVGFGCGDGTGALDESTRDSSAPLKRQCNEESRRRGMISPDLSPIYRSSNNNHSLMEIGGDDDYADLETFPTAFGDSSADIGSDALSTVKRNGETVNYAS